VFSIYGCMVQGFGVQIESLWFRVYGLMGSGCQGVGFGVGTETAAECPGSVAIRASIGTLLNLRTTASKKCAAVPRRARIPGSKTLSITQL